MSDVDPEEEPADEFTGFPERDPTLTGKDWDDDEIPDRDAQSDHDELGPQD